MNIIKNCCVWPVWSFILTSRKLRIQPVVRHLHIFRLLDVRPTQKQPLFLKQFFYARNLNSDAVGAYVLIFFFIFLEVPHDVLTSLQPSADCGQDKTLRRLENVCVLSDVCERYFNFLGKVLSLQSVRQNVPFLRRYRLRISDWLIN